MRQNPSFAMTDPTELRRVIEQNPWATLVSDATDGLVASHYVVLLDDERDDLTVVGHVGRPDDLVHDLGNRELLISFQGPHGYISPGWYGDVAAVPTWNYVSVHLTGVPEILSAEENLRVLGRMVDIFENRMPSPRGMWTLPNDEAFVQRMAAGTIGFRLTPTKIVAKRKLSQNKPIDTVEDVLLALEGSGEYANAELAAEMRRAHEVRKERQA
ncbi:FMN-binding negative transcriptional regulator [Microbacterium sp. H1-D42]|uniref:FMN-binding negative transcriptional regulator n=1 Tax=Microbacterium sp. H1-D42 TaxID=2925844 RepID=UPI001F52F472|nr:FMN-binding negative transcriptional regulator [Microbacterium sp. H1-D42]UNK72342.1 FMN-binding negative transcriptional regulator [Microbacterium sp. H1-D42]